MVMRTVVATRYVTPLREGGSLPGLVEADDDGLYVVKFRGAGQGPRALVAEWLAGEIGRAIGLRRPRPRRRSRSIPALATPSRTRRSTTSCGASGGLNLGMDFLPGRAAVQPGRGDAGRVIDPAFAADVVWLDALVTNPDRTAQNPNLLVWHGRPWLIDHGAALYIHHTWRDPDEHARRPFERIRDHVLLPFAGSIADADERHAATARRRRSCATSSRPCPTPGCPTIRLTGDAAAQREAYVRYLGRRLEAAARVRRGGRACPRARVARSSTRSSVCVPRVERGECLNVGVILLCRPRRFLGARIELDERRLAGVRARPRPGDGPPPSRRDRADRRGRPDGRPDRPARAGRALPLAGARRRARSSSRARSTRGCCDDPQAELDHLVATLVRQGPEVADPDARSSR